MNTPRHILPLFSILAALASLGLQAEEPDAVADLRQGKSYIPTTVYTADEDARIIQLFQGLRVADVSDGMDAVGMMGVGLMDPAILPLWKDTEAFSHRVIGIAVTARYMPGNRELPGRLPVDQYRRWAGQWYNQLSGEPFMELLREGSVLVIDDTDNDVGSIGSNNIMLWVERGAVGVITDATARDIDEVIAQEIPLYLRGVGRGIRPGRNMIESVNMPINCGGVLVRPGDVIVADGDGVICVPREVAEDVAVFAHRVLTGDKEGRRALYERLGIPFDPSVE